MKRTWIVLTAVALCFALGAPGLADHHDESEAQADQGAAGMPPMGPPPEMKKLEPMNGEYAVKFQFKMMPTDEEWISTDATAVVSMVAGGGAQQLLFDGHMMGMPFHGLGLTSFDRETGKWQMTWVDSMGARISNYSGEFADGKLVVTGEDLNMGMKIHSRLTTYDITDKGFEWMYEMSMDGTNWMDGARATYTKK